MKKQKNDKRINTKSRFGDVGMEFRDVGCVRIPFANNSNPFSAHSDWKSIKSYYIQVQIHIFPLFGVSRWGHFVWCVCYPWEHVPTNLMLNPPSARTPTTICSDVHTLSFTVTCIEPSCRLRNSDGWRDVFLRLFRTRSVMGRLWDDNFRVPTKILWASGCRFWSWFLELIAN